MENTTQQIDKEKIIEICKQEYQQKYGLPLDRVDFVPPPPARSPILPINDKIMVWHTLRDSFCAPLRLVLAELAGFRNQYDYYDDIPVYRCKKLGCFYFETFIGEQHFRLRSGFPRVPIEEFLPPIAFNAHPEAAVRMAIVVDPIVRCERFYKDRVRLHRIYNDESIQDTIKNLPARFENDDFARPQSYFLGDDASYYTHIFRHNEQDKVAALLSELSGATISLPSLPESEHDEEVKLTPAMKKQIKDIYSQDYAAFGKYFN